VGSGLHRSSLGAPAAAFLGRWAHLPPEEVMTIEIPMWLMWVLGIPAGAVIIGLAWLGWEFFKIARDFKIKP